MTAYLAGADRALGGGATSGRGDIVENGHLAVAGRPATAAAAHPAVSDRLDVTGFASELALHCQRRASAGAGWGAFGPRGPGGWVHRCRAALAAVPVPPP